MKQKNLIIVGLILLAVVVIGGFWLYDWVLGDTLEASQPIQATPVQVEITSPPSAVEATIAPTQAEAAQVEPTKEAVSESPTEAPESEPTGDLGETGVAIFSIRSETSQARFNIYEELRGQPKDVIGVTNQVAGEVAVDKSDLGATQVGVIQINARALETDDNRRNQAIRNRILLTDQYEFITFTPTKINGLSGEAQTGESYTFQITGDLTIRDVTQEVTFDVTVQMVSDTQLAGMATATIAYTDFGLSVPDVPFVANVRDTLDLEIDFVLEAK